MLNDFQYPNFSKWKRGLTPLIMSLLLMACGGDEGSPKISQKDVFLQAAKKMYVNQPNISQCDAGQLTQTTKQAFLTTVNEVRALSGLAPVVYDFASDNEVMQAALMFAANGNIDHQPDTSWLCYTEAGAKGAASSNLSGGTISDILAFNSPEEHVNRWMTDVKNVTKDAIEHRRWLLDPFLTKVAFGKVSTAFDANRVVNGVAAKILYDNQTQGTAASALIAYPMNDYPAKYFDKEAWFSVAVLSDADNKANNVKVDFSNTQVILKDRESGINVHIQRVKFDNLNAGLPNNLQFKPESIIYNKVYDVAINNVNIDGVNKNFTYTVKIVD